jgi:hypothetical protein
MKKMMKTHMKDTATVFMDPLGQQQGQRHGQGWSQQSEQRPGSGSWRRERSPEQWPIWASVDSASSLAFKLDWGPSAIINERLDEDL